MGIIDIVEISKMGDVLGVVGWLKMRKMWSVGIMGEGPDMRSNLFLSVVAKNAQLWSVGML